MLPNSFGSALDVWKCRIPERIGRAGRWRSWLLTARLPEWPRGENAGVCHQLSYYLELADCVGPVQWGADFPTLRVDADRAEALGMSGDNWVALAPGAAYGPAKQWPQDNFQQVAAWLLRQDLRVVLVGGGKEQAVAKAIADAVPSVLNLTGRTSITELMAVWLGCAAVANDMAPCTGCRLERRASLFSAPPTPLAPARWARPGISSLRPHRADPASAEPARSLAQTPINASQKSPQMT